MRDHAASGTIAIGTPSSSTPSFRDGSAFRPAAYGISERVDVKFIAPIAGARKKHYPFTAIDDCTRLRVLKIYNRLNHKSAIEFVDYGP